MTLLDRIIYNLSIFVFNKRGVLIVKSRRNEDLQYVAILLCLVSMFLYSVGTKEQMFYIVNCTSLIVTLIFIRSWYASRYVKTSKGQKNYFMFTDFAIHSIKLAAILFYIFGNPALFMQTKGILVIQMTCFVVIMLIAGIELKALISSLKK